VGFQVFSVGRDDFDGVGGVEVGGEADLMLAVGGGASTRGDRDGLAGGNPVGADEVVEAGGQFDYGIGAERDLSKAVG